MSALELENACAAPWGPPLLRDISLAVERGQVLGLAGPNGAGKTTLLKLMAGDIALQAGSLHFDGRSLASWPRGELARRRAYLPQLSLLNFPYTVEEVVALGRIPHASGARRDREIIAEAMAVTDVAGLRHRLYTRLSGGEKQRVQLARVLAQIWDADAGEQRLLLLDEPTAALDLSHQQLVLAAVRSLAAGGCAVVVAIHDLNLIAGIADGIAVIEAGRLAAMGTPAAVFNEQLLRRVFGIDVLVRQHPLRRQPLIVSR